MMIIDFNKNKDYLVPAIIQDVNTKNVLMLGYMNKEAFESTQNTKKVTFFSRSKNRLWTKGEESGNFLNLVDIKLDCDNDTLLIQVNPEGPTCHKNTDTCWNESNTQNFGFLSDLEKIIQNRKELSLNFSEGRRQPNGCFPCLIPSRIYRTLRKSSAYSVITSIL